MKVLILGGNGMLGHKLVQVLGEQFCVYSTLRRKFSDYENIDLFEKNKVFERVDVYDFAEIERIIEKLEPDVVINAVGVIKQIPNAKDVINTLTVNSIFPQKLAAAAKKLNFKLIAISTDCVFDGKKGNYIEEDVSDAVDLYGKSKNLGEVFEENCLTLRTSIIGREIETSHSLIEWFISNKGGRVKGFKNAVYTGFPTVILSEIIADLIKNFPDLQGLYHLSSKPINKFDLLKLVNEAYDLGIEIEPDEEFVIDRSLDSTKLRKKINFQPKTWEEMIRIMAEDPTPYEDWRKKLEVIS